MCRNCEWKTLFDPRKISVIGAAAEVGSKLISCGALKQRVAAVVTQKRHSFPRHRELCLVTADYFR